MQQKKSLSGVTMVLPALWAGIIYAFALAVYGYCFRGNIKQLVGGVFKL
jgi:hypothetical protein